MTRRSGEVETPGYRHTRLARIAASSGSADESSAANELGVRERRCALRREKFACQAGGTGRSATSMPEDRGDDRVAGTLCGGIVIGTPAAAFETKGPKHSPCSMHPTRKRPRSAMTGLAFENTDTTLAVDRAEASLAAPRLTPADSALPTRAEPCERADGEQRAQPAGVATGACESAAAARALRRRTAARSCAAVRWAARPG